MTQNKLLKYSVLALSLLLIAGAGLLLLRKAPKEDSATGMGLTIDPSSGTYVAPTTEAKEASSGIAIPGWGSITILAGETEVSVNLQNPTDNAGRYNMAFALYLEGDTQPIAKTGLIPHGESALKLNLTKPLEAGVYDALVLVQPYRISDSSPTNNAEIRLALVVE